MLTLHDIIGNIKKGQSAIRVREILSKLDETYVKIKNTISIVGCVSDTNKTTVYIKIPSETTARLLYDIVIELHTSTKVDLNTKFKVYSNSPAFGYNFAYVFHAQGSLLFAEKYPAQMKQIPPVTRNPYFSVGFDKHVYSSIRYVSEMTLPIIKQNFEGPAPAIKTFQEKQNESEQIRNDARTPTT